MGVEVVSYGGDEGFSGVLTIFVLGYGREEN